MGNEGAICFRGFYGDRGYQTGAHSRDGRMSDLRGLLNIHGSAGFLGSNVAVMLQPKGECVLGSTQNIGGESDTIHCHAHSFGNNLLN